MTDMTLWMAFTAGFLSFLSPCVLPLIPSYIGFITGISFSELASEEDRSKILRATVLNSLLFIVGFTIVFVLLGATATAVGTSLNRYQNVIRWVGGALVIVLGVHFTGLINIKFLQIEKRMHLKSRPVGYVGAVLIGMAFAAGWTPCIGPILGSILMVAATQTEIVKGMALLAVYSLGFGIPFFLSAIALNKFLTTYKKLSRHIPKIIVASGVILIVIGVLIITNNLSMLGLLLTDWFS
ncbi:MAG: cytochrome c biogenesis CcdA family protein [Elusimicrobiota bacterium]